MQLTIGPILFDWNKDQVLSFYDKISDMPVDRIYIGEVVCAKKKGLSAGEIKDICGRLEKKGKEVVVSTLAVVSNEAELGVVRELCNLPFSVEANDMSALNILAIGRDGRFLKGIVAGPHITTYNVPSIDFLKGLGIERVVFPLELSGDSMKYCLKETGISGEVFAHGKAPLAFSWRCYTSRSYRLGKANCHHHCRLYPEGMLLRTADGTSLFTINGTSVLSATTYTLVEYIEELREIGMSALRISPQIEGMSTVISIFRKRIDGMMEAEEAIGLLGEGSRQGFCNGWYHGMAGKEYLGKREPSRTSLEEVNLLDNIRREP